jgi:hypothetical protein
MTQTNEDAKGIHLSSYEQKKEFRSSIFIQDVYLVAGFWGRKNLCKGKGI